jgi:GPI inositol-deacylase
MKIGNYCIHVVAVGIVAICVWQVLEKQHSKNYCAMTYMRPTYLPIALSSSQHNTDASHHNHSQHSKYRLFLYREVEQLKHDGSSDIRGIPVLYIPGNAGSYQQVHVNAMPHHMHAMSHQSASWHMVPRLT